MANPTSDQSLITSRGTVLKDDNGNPTSVFNYVNITGTGTTLVKTGAGFLHSITINDTSLLGTIEVDDALTNTTPKIATLSSNVTNINVPFIYDVAFSTGLSVTVTGTTDATISYR